jgi:predicted PurR-regulated permease PerM
MLVLAVIPFAGTGVVLIPTGLIKILSGEVWQGITIICISVFFISLIDNFLRPRLVGRDTGLHDLMVFFSTLGGISVFGPAGFIIGPLIAAIFLTILDMYRIEFQEHIAYPKSAVKTKKNKPS